MDNEQYVLAFSPHITDSSTVSRIMMDVIIALLPACGAAIYFFGVQAAILLAVSVASAMATEALIQVLCKRRVTVLDGSAAVTGVLLALNPVSYTHLRRVFCVFRQRASQRRKSRP